jgi:hypothetical protein
MDEIFTKSNLCNTAEQGQGWTESQYNQLKNQIIAYKYLIRNQNVPIDVLDKIRSYESEEWNILKQKNMEKIQENYEKRFENHDLVIFFNLVYERTCSIF